MIHEISTDGTTVWINSVDGLLGRFGKRGIDIHNTVVDQIKTGKMCLSCNHSETTRDDWLRFVYEMNALHGVQIDSTYTPIRFALPRKPIVTMVPAQARGEVRTVAKRKARKWNTQNMQLTVELSGNGVVIRKPTIGNSIGIGNMNDLLELIYILKKASHRLCDDDGVKECAKEELADDARAAKKAFKKNPPKLSLVK